jgi:hypothetical protein
MAKILTPEEGKELQRLMEAHAKASLVAAKYAADMNSREFKEADAETGRLWVAIWKLRGESPPRFK